MEGTIATVMLFAGNFEPLSWAYCNGQLMSIANYTAVFALVGTTYGGDGQTTFALPDLRGRVPVGTGSVPGRSIYDLGQVGGTESVTMLSSQLPSHTHNVSMPVSGNSPSTEEPDGAILANTGSNLYAGVAAKTGDYGGVTASVAGANQPISIMSPYLALNYVFCLEGIFPSRN